MSDLPFSLIISYKTWLSLNPWLPFMWTNPIPSPILTSPAEEPQTINDFVIDLVKNPLDITNSIELSNEISHILTDSERDNNQIACDLGGEQINNLLGIINYRLF